MTNQELILDQTEEQHQVDAIELGRSFYTISDAGEPQQAGRIHLTQYDSGKAKAAVFHSNDGKEYALGNVSKNYRPVDHFRVINPLVEAGFSDIKMVKNNRGGAGVFALLSNPDVRIDHNISWDTEVYGGGSQSLNLAIGAWVDARVGKSIRIVAGFFRSICANGLVSHYLNLGHMKSTSYQFSAEKVAAIANRSIESVNDFGLQTFSPEIVKWPLQLLDKYDDDPAYIDSLPKFARVPFTTAIAGMPQWCVEECGYQLELMGSASTDITMLDVLNMVTNVANQGTDSNQIHFNMEGIVGAFVQLMAISAFKLDLDFPVKVG